MRKIYTLPLLFVLTILWIGASAIIPSTFPGNSSISKFTAYHSKEKSIATVPLDMPAVAGISVSPAKATLPTINEVPVTNIQGLLTNEFTGTVLITWECTPSAGFLYYILKRDGTEIATIPSATEYTDILPVFGIYTYCVEAMYTTGTTAPACIDEEWPSPSLTWAPDSLIATVWSGTSSHRPLSIGNNGLGTLSFAFPDYVDHPGDSPLAYCAASATGQDEYIGRVQFASIDNTSGWEGYSDYTSLSTHLIKGVSAPITVTNGGNSYSQDKLYVWIDYDHNTIFDANELTQLASQGGGYAFSGTIAVPSTALTGYTTMRIRMSYSAAADPCGTQSYGEVEDYTVNIYPPTFATNVVPASGFIASSEHQIINVEFSAAGDYAVEGIYYSTLKLFSNDLNHPSVDIPLKMIVGMPGAIQGVVTDCVTGEPINGALVQAGWYTTMTNETGAYTLYVDAGTYYVNFSKVGYQTVMALGIVSGSGVTTINPQMCEIPYPPDCAYASVNFEDTQCTVSWCPPAAVQEMIFDDGTAENYAAWQFASNKYAVKFTPQGYPAKISGAKFMIGDGPYGVTVGTPFQVLVCKADAAGLPGEIIDSVPADVNNLGWMTINGLNATITSGDFFIVMEQGSPSPNCAYLGVDETLPLVNRSYSRNVINGQDWQLSAYQDFMIRPIVSCPDTSGVVAYELSRISLGAINPVPPASGVFLLLGNIYTGTTYFVGGSSWTIWPQGWYAFGIKTIYANGQESEFAFTNNVVYHVHADLTINAQLGCGSVPAEGAIVKLSGLYYPYYSVTDTVPASGTLTFSQIIQGDLTVTVAYPGYDSYTETLTLDANKVINVNLAQSLNSPINMSVNEANLVASWEEPRVTLMSQNFESGNFPPPAWQNSTQGIMGWYSANNGSSANFVIPQHTKYAVVNDELGGSTNNGCCDSLITPVMDLRAAPDYELSFSSYYTGFNGQLANVVMSIDGGATWTSLYTVQPSVIWQNINIDLSAYSGPGGLAAVKFAFHADDAGNQASGWAVDDVMVSYGGAAVSGYKVYLDGVEVGQTNATSWNFDPATITCAPLNEAGVAAIYCTGDSEQATDVFPNLFPYPPLNLVADTNITSTTGSAVLRWDSMACVSPWLLSYRVYRDNLAIADVPPSVFEYLDLNLLPGSYCYAISAVYDLAPLGFPGQTGESNIEGPECVDIIYGGDLPFTDDFSGGEFDTTIWNPGQNWLVDEDSDNPVPAAKFRWDPVLNNYSNSLESTSINATAISISLPYMIYLDYDVKLEDNTASGTENLTVEIWNGSSWNLVKQYPNTGTFDWTAEHLNITEFADSNVFKVRFRANGVMSGEIHYWAVDNVHIYTGITMAGPFNLVAQLLNPAGNDIKVSWTWPSGAGTVMDYILDDNSAETGISFDPVGEYWVGNVFPVTEAGILQSASVFMNTIGGATYSIDIFDASRTFLGSSGLFTPAFDAWTDVYLPDISFNGTFYMMLHLVVPAQTAVLAYDTNGPNAFSDLEWFYDGSGWSKLSAAGVEPGVCMVRAKALVGDKKTAISFGPGSQGNGYVSPLAVNLNHQLLVDNTGSENTHIMQPGIDNDSIMGFNLYRREYAVFPAGQNSANTGNWNMIANVHTNEYIDAGLLNLASNCYEYKVTTLYMDGESLPSNIDWECIFTDVKSFKPDDVRIYPNPATTFVRIDLNRLIDKITVYNSLGTVITQKNVKGETNIMLNTAGYAAGAYSVKFTTTTGDTFSRKFVVTK